MNYEADSLRNEAYRQGRRAALLGNPKESNPYERKDMKLKNLWAEAYDSAMRDIAHGYIKEWK